MKAFLSAHEDIGIVTFDHRLCVCVQTVDGRHFPAQVHQLPDILQFCCSQENREESIINNVKHQEVSDPKDLLYHTLLTYITSPPL